MSELKPYIGPHPIDHTLTEYYLKSEADKVITKLKEKLVEQTTLRVWAEIQLRHNKYKRCLAMAKWCERKRIDAANYRIPRQKWDFYDKWQNRWLELAEKFKHNNSTAQ